MATPAQVAHYQGLAAQAEALKTEPTEAQILAGARALSAWHAKLCNVDAYDTWALLADDFKADAAVCLGAALAVQS